MKKQILSLTLALALILSLSPVSAPRSALAAVGDFELGQPNWANTMYQQGWATDGANPAVPITGNIGLSVERLKAARYLVVRLNTPVPAPDIKMGISSSEDGWKDWDATRYMSDDKRMIVVNLALNASWRRYVIKNESVEWVAFEIQCWHDDWLDIDRAYLTDDLPADFVPNEWGQDADGLILSQPNWFNSTQQRGWGTDGAEPQSWLLQDIGLTVDQVKAANYLVLELNLPCPNNDIKMIVTSDQTPWYDWDVSDYLSTDKMMIVVDLTQDENWQTHVAGRDLLWLTFGIQAWNDDWVSIERAYLSDTMPDGFETGPREGYGDYEDDGSRPNWPNTVIFQDYDGTILNTVAIDRSAAAAPVAPAVPARPGYSFTGWKLNHVYGGAYQEILVRQDTLTATATYTTDPNYTVPGAVMLPVPPSWVNLAQQQGWGTSGAVPQELAIDTGLTLAQVKAANYLVLEMNTPVFNDDIKFGIGTDKVGWADADATPYMTEDKMQIVIDLANDRNWNRFVRDADIQWAAFEVQAWNNDWIDLKRAYLTNAVVIDDGQYIEDNDITVAVEAAPDTPAAFANGIGKIRVEGAGFNANPGGAIALNFTVPDKTADIDALNTQYGAELGMQLSKNSAVQVEITLEANGVAITDLLYPVTITVPIPSGINSEKFWILHQLQDGSYFPIKPVLNGDGTCSFTVSHFSLFIFAHELAGDAETVTAAKEALTWDAIKGANTALSSVTASLNLIASGADGVTISWASSNTGVISGSGAVTRPAYGRGAAAVTLTATLSKGTATETKTFTITVPEQPYSGSSSNGTSGGTTTTPTPNPPAAQTPAADIPSDWADKDVKEAVKLGIVPASLQSSYRANLKRSEFCALAVGLYEYLSGKPIEARGSFIDTADINVQKLAGLGIVKGDGTGRFDPDGVFSREMAVTLMYNMMVQLGGEFEDAEPAFADAGGISSWARQAVGALQKAGVLEGDGVNFKPKEDFTREMGIAIVMHFLDEMKK